LTQKTLGTLLRELRKNANYATVAEFAAALQLVGLNYTVEAVGHWERDARTPNRDVLLTICELLAARGAIVSLEVINQLLTAAGMNALNERESADHFVELDALERIPNLPSKPPYTHLVGRDDVLDKLVNELANPQGARVVVISGLGGIGKTALAYEVMKRVMRAGYFTHLVWETAKSEEFSHGQVTARPAQLINLPTLLASYARQLGLTALATLPAHVLQARLSEIFQSGNYLIALDNLETLAAAQEIVRTLNAMVGDGGKTRLLITSRERLVGEAYAFDQFVRGLSEPDALHLLADEARRRGADSLLNAERDLLHDIYAVTGGMPLALQLIVSQYLLGIALDEELARLKGAVDEEELYRFIYFRLWQQLTKPARRLLIAAATYSTWAFRQMLQGVSKLTDADFHSAVADLIRMSLLEMVHHPKASQQVYDVHALTRWFINGPLTDLWNQQRGREDSDRG
jgi:hypothetical protein